MQRDVYDSLFNVWSSDLKHCRQHKVLLGMTKLIFNLARKYSLLSPTHVSFLHDFSLNGHPRGRQRVKIGNRHTKQNFSSFASHTSTEWETLCCYVGVLLSSSGSIHLDERKSDKASSFRRCFDNLLQLVTITRIKCVFPEHVDILKRAASDLILNAIITFGKSDLEERINCHILNHLFEQMFMSGGGHNWSTEK